MIYLINSDGNVKLGFDFLTNLPEDFDVAKSEFEKWVPFVLNISTPERTISITKDMRAHMTLYEVKKIFTGLKNLIECIGDNEDRKFTHYSSESFFEFSFEYLHIDDCFNLELWFINAEFTAGQIVGYDVGFRFVMENSEIIRFAEEFLNRFNAICPQCSI